MEALYEAYKLERTLSRAYKAAAWLTEDIGRTFPMRLFREGRRLGVEPVLEAVYSGMKTALTKYPELSDTMLRCEKAFALATDPNAVHAVAMTVLEQEMGNWRKIKTLLLEKDRAATEDLVVWLDRDIEEQIDIARRLGGGGEPPVSRAVATKSAQNGSRARTAVEKGLSQAEKVALADAEKRAAVTLRVYEAFVGCVRNRPDQFGSFNRLAAYFPKGDPMWERIAEKVISHSATDTGHVAYAIQGVIGEALALRNAWVVDSIVKATERAHRIAAKLGKEWEVVFTQAPVFASTKAGSLGEIYDASVWIVKKGTGTLQAAPVFVLQVKSGGSRAAAEQTARDFSRELEGTVLLPTVDAAGKAGGSIAKPYAIKNLRHLLGDKGVKETAGEVGGLTTQRMLVSPRAPSTGTLLEHLPNGASIDYVGGLMTQTEVKGLSEAIRDALPKRIESLGQ
jgi:hypothetical protein